jgi:hypothetical protein
MVLLKRKHDGNILGTKYDGNNIKEVINAFSPLDNVMWSADDGSLTSSSGQCVCIGDWVVNDEGVIRVYTSGNFSLRFEEKNKKAQVRTVRVAEPLLSKEDFDDFDDEDDESNYYEEWR